MIILVFVCRHNDDCYFTIFSRKYRTSVSLLSSRNPVFSSGVLLTLQIPFVTPIGVDLKRSGFSYKLFPRLNFKTSVLDPTVEPIYSLLKILVLDQSLLRSIVYVAQLNPGSIQSLNFAIRTVVVIAIVPCQLL